MIKAVLLDLDGTLLDTLGDIQYYTNEALAAFSYPPITLEETARYVGDGAWDLIERACPKGAKDLEACFEYFREHFAHSTQERTKLYDGELACLQALKERGYRLGVVTNKPQDATEGCIRKFFPEGLFDFVGGDSGNFPKKPDPTLARYAALSLRVAPEECAFVGDGETDAHVALNAGMFGVSVLWGYRTREQLIGAGATRFVSSYPELLRLLTNEATR